MPQPTDNTGAIAFPKPQEPKKGKTLSPRLHKQLLAYVAVAGAGVAACASRAEAEIIYTPVHSRFNFDYFLDLNHDGINDFKLRSYYLSGYGDVQVFPLITGNRIVATPQSCYYHHAAAAALKMGAVIGPGPRFLQQANCMVQMFSWISSGPWVNTGDHYLGFAFQIDGKEHFGWARISVHLLCAGEITGYAYETVPDKPIVAGDTGQSTEAAIESPSLGMLALGVPGLNLWGPQRCSHSKAATLCVGCRPARQQDADEDRY